MTDRLGRPVAQADKLGLLPIYFTEKTRPTFKDYRNDFIELSRKMWGYHNYVGLITPWHDETDPLKMVNIRDDKMRAWVWNCEDMDVHWKTYCVLSFACTDYMFWERPTLLIGQRAHWSWMRRLREYAGSSQRMDDIAFFLLEVLRLQIEAYGKALLSRASFIGADASRKNADGRLMKKFILYEKIADRLTQLQALDVDYYDWIGEKFRLMKDKFDEMPAVAGVVNVNAFDPEIETLKTKVADPWRVIRDFLGLMPECEFPDGSLPKGWQPATDDVEADRKRIVKVTADGYYYYEDGTQRRGRRHYASNKYLTIKCSPENFSFFKALWDDPRLLSGNPTWEEYSQHALHPGIWNEEGKNVSEQYKALKNVRWRKG